jgi:transcriptional regulator with XRE-family HTH domain
MLDTILRRIVLENKYEFEIGELVYSIRKLNGLTQVDFSKKLGVVQSTVSKIEKGFFDDVPFSLISKISLLFKIPLAQFQSGLLTIKNTSNLKKIIPGQHTKDGEISAKTIFFLLNKLSELTSTDVYKSLKLHRQYFCISNLFFNKEFMISLNEKYPEELTVALASLSKQSVVSENNGMLGKYLSSMKSIQVIETQKINNKTIFKLHLPHLNIHSSQLNEFYSKCFALDLSLIFEENITSEFLKTSDNQYLQLEVVH